MARFARHMLVRHQRDERGEASKCVCERRERAKRAKASEASDEAPRTHTSERRQRVESVLESGLLMDEKYLVSIANLYV